MDPASSPLADFQQELLSTRQDPKVMRLALRWAGNRELAEDALQTVYCRVASVQHPESIVNLHAYFLRALDDLEVLGRPQPGTSRYGPASEPAIDDKAYSTLQTEIWLKRHAGQCDRLNAATPARSADPARYRQVIYAAAKQVLLGHLSLEPNDPDFPKAIRAAYPEYFDQPGAAPNTLHQRISRARDDIKALLRAIIKPDELY